ncbi:HAD-superfamily hydrolase, subfamily IA, variant 3 [Fibrella aestuarina BUZ 2]|uniref:HAD-superfamily hydrolase, subfamily IA, variant 3 n=1 Tax=Fibrella aestuarina BUZ 2 TaxID=1166018 RepID=I0K9D7_9BACT|nr:HAD family phosphatase [Fibrella aestuarina]CCH00740.1 HAD-superfamily hydrolase, subfamily IA, variant 3 [Fibrella aestuarina BUZ 2]
MPKPIAAALFDMDGVLIDNARFHRQNWFALAKRHGRPLTPDQYDQFINGRVAASSLPYLLGRELAADELLTMATALDSDYRQLYAPHLAPTPGLGTFLEHLKAGGIRCGVGSSAPPENIDLVLDGLAIRAYFDTVVNATMIRRGKPDPEIYLTAAERLSQLPEQCVVFEDAFSGIEAGLRANMRVVALATTHTRAELTNAGADLIIDDFNDPALLPWLAQAC